MLLMVLPLGGEQKTLGVRVGAGRLGTHLKKKEAGLLYRQSKIYIKNLYNNHVKVLKIIVL